MALVQVEAYLNRKKKYFSTKVYLSPDQWDFKKRMVKNHPNADAINHMLYEFMAEIEKKELGLWQQGKQISLDSLKIQWKVRMMELRLLRSSATK